MSGARPLFVGVEDAVARLREGQLVALPTETVYGLGADARQAPAVRRIFAAKGRPVDHPLIVHLASSASLGAWAAHVPPAARRLADVLWPGPLTLVLPRGASVLDEVTGGLSTVALRVPSHPVARAVLERFGGGVAAPSANRFGAVSPTRAEDVVEGLGDAVDAIVDGGPCEVGIESTIVDVSGGAVRLLRPGGVTREILEDVLGAPIEVPGDSEGPRAPGRLASHYAPRARVVAVRVEDVDAEARAWSSRRPGAKVVILSPLRPQASEAAWQAVPADPVARARTLYADLRGLDAAGVEIAIVAMPEDAGGLGLAIRDRLRRAAGPR